MSESYQTRTRGDNPDCFASPISSTAIGGRVAVHEIMTAIPAIRNLIREDKIAQMYSSIQTGASHGMQTMDQCLKSLVSQGIITNNAAREKAQDKTLFGG